MKLQMLTKEKIKEYKEKEKDRKHREYAERSVEDVQRKQK